uniref:Uncharacterized protein n=1 Tax=Romanomermis culicivorax TaxID=13658 RepID=A0A915I9W4_ROMCU
MNIVSMSALVWHIAFAEIPTTDNIRRGEVVFNREQAKFNVLKDCGFLVNEHINRGMDFESKKVKGGFSGGMSNPGVGTWNSYRLVSARVADDRLSAAYAFLILKHKDADDASTIFCHFTEDMHIRLSPLE